MTLQQYFSTGPPHEKPVFEAIMAHLRQVGPVHVEPVSVGIFLKRAQTFAELRPKDNWVALGFSLRRRVSHPLVKRKIIEYHGRYYHVANIRGPDDVDQDLLDLISEAYLGSPPP